jgi:predicted ArsR family transcriptional regulator
MKAEDQKTLNRRQLLTRTAPACALGCLGIWSLPDPLAACVSCSGQEVHKFDQTQDRSLSVKQLTQVQYSELFSFMRNVREEVGKEELIRLLKIHSEATGRQVGTLQAQNSPDTEFKTFVATFRPPRYAQTLTHEIVEDTEGTFELKVTECIWATVFKEAGLDGDIGHAAVCNMDYYWPTAFNPDFKMERDKTLMEGHDCCNHRYLNTATRG